MSHPFSVIHSRENNASNIVDDFHHKLDTGW